ncbi:hypothetical protein QTL86_19025 [Cellulosilyticum sp. ST5]|uniref:hypothetical protein n=1 Tax=Cellulosilyticum sp. ST5 TaxID=3055805 RepID=UPI003977DEEB
MSAFLGPIHYWLYNKIQMQQDLVEEIMLLAEQKWGLNLAEEADEYYGKAERRPLEQVIDGTNIHGWLQEQVSNAEYKLAFCVTKLIKNDKNALEVLRVIFESKGRDKARTIETNLKANELYKVITDSWLDGMPCDHAYLVIEQGEESITFRRNSCVHESYWKAVEGNIDDYYELRNAWIKGLLEEQKAKLEKIDEVTYKLEKEDKYE